LKRSKKTSLPITAVCFSYDDIPLKLYLQIASTANYGLLLKSGAAPSDHLINVWGQIVKRNSQITGSLDYNSYVRLLKTYGGLDADYKIARSYIMMLHLVIDDGQIAWLNEHGYVIDGKATNEVFQQQLVAAQTKVGNMVNKIKNKLKELNDLRKDKADGEDSANLEEILASMSFHLGFSLDQEITLARYNQFNKILKKAKTAKQSRS
jgi:hypothetical protein